MYRYRGGRRGRSARVAANVARIAARRAGPSSIPYAWRNAGGNAPGYTLRPDDRLIGGPAPSARVDLILYGADAMRATATAVELLGEALADRTPSGLWSSDHVGVTATVRFTSDGQ